MNSDPRVRHVAITGGAGFLGRHLALNLVEKGWRVTVFDNLSSGNVDRNSAFLHHPLIRFREASMFDSAEVNAIVGNHQYIVHLASIVGVGETIENPVQTAENLLGTINLVRALTSNHIVVFGSSADVYGLHSLHHGRPMREDDDVTYEHALVNRWIYPKIKSVEESVIAASSARSLAIRIFNAYGPDMDFPKAKRVIPQFARQIFDHQPIRIHGTGRQVRSFCYYTDMVAGFAQALDYAAQLGAGGHETLNMGSDRPISIMSLAELMVNISVDIGLSPARVKIITDQSEFYAQSFNDSWDRIPDLSRVRDRLDFRTVIPLEEGLRHSLLGYFLLAKDLG